MDPDSDEPVVAKASTATLDAVQLSRRGGAMRCSLVDGRAKLVGRAIRTGGGQLAVFDSV